MRSPLTILAVVLLPYLGLPVQTVSMEKQNAKSDLETTGSDDVNDDQFYEFEDKLLRLWLEHIIDRYNTNVAQSSAESKNIQRIAKKGRTSASSTAQPRNRNVAPFPIYPLLFNPSYHPVIYSSYVPLHHSAGRRPIPVVPPTAPCPQEMYHHQVVLPLHTRLPYVYAHFMSPAPIADHPNVKLPAEYHAYLPPHVDPGMIRKYELIAEPEPTYGQTELFVNPDRPATGAGTDHAPPVVENHRPEESVRIEHKTNDAGKPNDGGKPISATVNNRIGGPNALHRMPITTAAVEPNTTPAPDKTVDPAGTRRTTAMPVVRMTVSEKSNPPETFTTPPPSSQLDAERSTAPEPSIPVTEQPDDTVDSQPVTAGDNDFADAWNARENSGVQREAESPRPPSPVDAYSTATDVAKTTTESSAEKTTRPTVTTRKPDDSTTKHSSEPPCENGECRRTTRSLSVTASSVDGSIAKKPDSQSSPRMNDEDDERSNSTSPRFPEPSAPTTKPSNSKIDVAENAAKPSTGSDPPPASQPRNGNVPVNSISTGTEILRPIRPIATNDDDRHDERQTASTPPGTTVKLEPFGQTTRNGLPSDIRSSTESYPGKVHEYTERTSAEKTEISAKSMTTLTNPRESDQEKAATTVSVTDDSKRKRSTDNQNGSTPVTVASETLKDSDLWYGHMSTLKPRKKELNEEQINFLLKKLIKLLKPEIEKQMLTEENMERFIIPKIRDQDKLIHVIFPWVKDAAKNMDNEDGTMKTDKHQNVL